MQRLLIAGTSDCFANGISKQLKNLYDINICNDGEKLIGCICNLEPDILLLDMSIPGVDCLALLRSVSASGKRTAVIALLNVSTHYILHCLEQLGVQYVLTKPCHVNLAVTHIRQIDFYMQHPDMVGWNVENETENILLDLGFSIGRTTMKKVRTGPHPSMAAASSISNGRPLTKPTNIKMARPAPKPRYTTGMVQGVFSFNLSAVKVSVNITIWKGTIMENRHR